MSSSSIYSVRMHATRNGAHLSGAERLASPENIDEIALSFLRRALCHPRGTADALRLTMEGIETGSVRGGRLPDVTTCKVANWQEGRETARSFLLEAGVLCAAADAAFAALAAGAAPAGGNMRGAMLVDAQSGRRLEPDPNRGVRASRMDMTQGACERLQIELSRRSLNNLHVREALVLAGKVAAAPGVVAELCWSDDPDYTAGYVCTALHGYVRFPHLKPLGEEIGGRAFFLHPQCDTAETIAFLEKAVILFDEIGIFHPDRDLTPR
jgi:6-carboxyhexanoate--CoA ligase